VPWHSRHFELFHVVTRDASMSVDDSSGDRRVLGWREWVALPELGIPAIRAKIDTGARSSALHVEAIEEFRRDDADWVRFKLDPVSRSRRRARWIEAPLLDRREVTDSGGGVSLRPFILTDVQIANQRYAIEINLTNRRGMLFPMLLGRTAMRGRWLIDPEQSYVLGDASTHTPSPTR
jgi:hypothetical protein